MKWIFALAGLAVGAGSVYQGGQEQKQSADSVYTFQKDIAPLLKQNCTPCHYPGGKVFRKLPFEDYRTVRTLGKKLNTRFNKEDQQRVVNQWVERGSRK